MDQVKDWIERPCAYNNVDGVAELGMGFMLLGFAAFQWLNAHTPQTAVWHRVYVLFAYLAILSLVLHYGTKFIKERITYPRTGFVAYRKQHLRRTVILSFCAGALAPLVFATAARSHWHFAAVPLIFGLAMTATVLRLTKPAPWKWIIAGATLIATGVTAFLPAEFFAALIDDSDMAKHPALTQMIGGSLLCSAVYGAIFLISGSISLWLYLHNTQPPVQVEP